MIKEIKSRQNDLIKEVSKLSNPSFRKEKGQFKVDGFHMFEMAKSSNFLGAWRAASGTVVSSSIFIFALFQARFLI